MAVSRIASRGVSKKLGVGSQTNQFDDKGFGVNPDEQEIAAHMTFHAASIVSLQTVGAVFARHFSFLHQMKRHFAQRAHLGCVVAVFFQVFLELSRLFEFIHG